MRNRRQIESGIMEQLQTGGIGQYRTQIWCRKVTVAAKTHKMFIAASVGNLQQAQPVTRGDEPHGFGVYGDGAIGQYACGKVFFV